MHEDHKATETHQGTHTEQPGIIEGRMVHYVLPDGHSKGQHRAAVIVKTWGTLPKSAVNLKVITDGFNDYPPDHVSTITGFLWKTSVPYSENKEPGTWHWIEQA